MWKSRDKKKGEEKSRRNSVWWTRRQKIYNTGQPVDEQKTRKLKTSSVEASNRRRQNRQEWRNEDKQEKVRWEESLSIQNGQRKRRERAGGAGQ